MDNDYFKWRNKVRGNLLEHYRLWTTEDLKAELDLADKTRDVLIKNYKSLDRINERLTQLRNVIRWREQEGIDCPCDEVTHWF